MGVADWFSREEFLNQSGGTWWTHRSEDPKKDPIVEEAEKKPADKETTDAVFAFFHQAEHPDLLRGNPGSRAWRNRDFDLYGSKWCLRRGNAHSACVWSGWSLTSACFSEFRVRFRQARIRQAGTSTADTVAAAQGNNANRQLTTDQARSQASRFATSTNLAEVSDWLTKLLLGAGLVSLTKIGAPLGHLIDTVAAGLTVTTSPSSSAKLVAGCNSVWLWRHWLLGWLPGHDHLVPKEN